VSEASGWMACQRQTSSQCSCGRRGMRNFDHGLVRIGARRTADRLWKRHMLQLHMSLEVIITRVVLATDVARKRDRRMGLLVAFQIVFAREGLGTGRHGTTEGTAVEMLIPNMVVQMIEPLARGVLVNVVERVELLLGSVDSTVPE